MYSLLGVGLILLILLVARDNENIMAERKVREDKENFYNHIKIMRKKTPFKCCFNCEYYTIYNIVMGECSLTPNTIFKYEYDCCGGFKWSSACYNRVSNHRIKAKFILESNYKVLFLVLSEEDIKKKLLTLKVDSQPIENFLITSFIANVNQLLYHINCKRDQPINMEKLKRELLRVIFKLNPSLSNYIIRKKWDSNGKQIDTKEEGVVDE